MKAFFLIHFAVLLGLSCFGLAACADTNASTSPESETSAQGQSSPSPTDGILRIDKSQKQWREQLTDEQFEILRNRGTERAFHNAFWDQKQAGLYRCAGCGQLLFDSRDKFKSGTGWPSFTKPLAAGQVRLVKDTRGGMVRNEVVCSRCGGHLGHLFHDGPAPTGLRYCLDSAALTFQKQAPSNQ